MPNSLNPNITCTSKLQNEWLGEGKIDRNEEASRRFLCVPTMYVLSKNIEYLNIPKEIFSFYS